MSEADISGAEDRLARFFAEDGLPDQDPAFALAVMDRMARKRLRLGLLTLGGFCALAALVLWAFAPWLGLLAADLPRDAGAWAPVGISLVIVVSLLVMTAAPPWARPAQPQA